MEVRSQYFVWMTLHLLMNHLRGALVHLTGAPRRGGAVNVEEMKPDWETAGRRGHISAEWVWEEAGAARSTLEICNFSLEKKEAGEGLRWGEDVCAWMSGFPGGVNLLLTPSLYAKNSFGRKELPDGITISARRRALKSLFFLRPFPFPPSWSAGFFFSPFLSHSFTSSCFATFVVQKTSSLQF